VLDPRRLLLLVDVVRAGSITSAASRLNYTTSAVSQQISKLESEAGQPLLERHARGVRLTEAGAALVRRAERIETQLLAAGTELDDIAGLRSGTVRLGTFPTAGSSLLPPVVKLFKSRHPAIGLTVRSSRFAQLRAMLDAREIEMSLLWDYAWDPVNDPELTVRVLLVDPPGERLPAAELARETTAAGQDIDERADPAALGRRHRVVIDARVADEEIVVVAGYVAHGARFHPLSLRVLSRSQPRSVRRCVDECGIKSNCGHKK